MQLRLMATLSGLVLASVVAFADSPYPPDTGSYSEVNYRTDPDVQSLLNNVHQLEPEIQRVVWVFKAMKWRKNIMLMCNVHYVPGVQHADDGTQCENVRLDYNVPGIPGPNVPVGASWSIHYDSAFFEKKVLKNSKFKPDCR